MKTEPETSRSAVAHSACPISSFSINKKGRPSRDALLDRCENRLLLIRFGRRGCGALAVLSVVVEVVFFLSPQPIANTETIIRHAKKPNTFFIGILKT